MPSVLLNAMYAMFVTNSPFWMRMMLSKPNAEKVVKAAKNPPNMIIFNPSVHWACSAKCQQNPAIKQPIKLTANVPHGNVV